MKLPPQGTYRLFLLFHLQKLHFQLLLFNQLLELLSLGLFPEGVDVLHHLVNVGHLVGCRLVGHCLLVVFLLLHARIEFVVAPLAHL